MTPLPVLSVALPEGQTLDGVRVPVSVLYSASSGESVAADVRGGVRAWESSVAAPHDFCRTSAFLRALTTSRVCGATVMEHTMYQGVPMWQFFYEALWERLYLLLELVDALEAAIDSEAPAVLEVQGMKPESSELAVVWREVATAVAEARGVRVAGDLAVASPYKTKLLRAMRRDLASWRRPEFAPLRVDVSKDGSRRTARRLPAGRKLLFASIPRHWTADPLSRGQMYDEQYTPLLPVLREAGWREFIGLECPYDSTEATLAQRAASAAPDVMWRAWDWYGKYPATQGRDHVVFARMLRSLLRDQGFRASTTYRGVSLLRALLPGLEAGFMSVIPTSARAIETAGRILDVESPDVVLVTYETGRFGLALVIEADRRGIPTVALQHGLIDERHNAYMTPAVTTCPSTGAAAFAIADRTLVWGRQWQRVLTEVGPYPEDAVAITGNWRYDSIVENREDIRAAFRSEMGYDPSQVVVLVLLSGFDVLGYVRICLECIGAMHGTVPLVKLHPAVDPEPTRTFLRSVSLPDRTLVGERMSAAILGADVVISQVSTAVSEAVFLGRPVVLVDFEGIGEVGGSAAVPMGCLHVGREQDLGPALEAVLQDPAVRNRLAEEGRYAAREQFYIADGRAARRVTAEVARLLSEPGFSRVKEPT